MFSARLNAFRYNCTKPPNGKTRVYLAIDPNSTLINESIFLLDNKDQIVDDEKLISGAYIDVLPSTFGSTQYKIVYGRNCKGIKCPFQVLVLLFIRVSFNRTKMI
jgi:hypothetical protein